MKPSPRPVSRRTVAAAAGLLAAAALLAAGCTGGGGSSTSGSSSPTPAPPSPTPAGSVRVGKLSFVPPDGFTRVTERAKLRNTTATWEAQGTRKPPAAAPVLDVFVEKRDVGSLTVRGAEIRALANVSLKNATIVSDRTRKVPGATGARIIEFSYPCANQPKASPGKGGKAGKGGKGKKAGDATADPSAAPSDGASDGTTGGRPLVRCHQIEYLVQAPRSPQYGLRLFAAGGQYDPADRDALLASLRVGR